MKTPCAILLSSALLLTGLSGCGSKAKTGQENSPDLCRDSIDNDGDGFLDCDDQDCEAYCPVPEDDPMLCSDGRDNDADGLTDCDDPDCGAFCTDASSDPTHDPVDPSPDVTDAADFFPDGDAPPEAPDTADGGEDLVIEPIEEDMLSEDPVEADDTSDDTSAEEPLEEDAGEEDAEDIEEDEGADVPEDDICNVGLTGDPCERAAHCTCVPGAAVECLATLSGYVSFPGGYCSARCTSAAECGPGADCAEITVGTRYCLKRCSSFSQCRMAEGYGCLTIPMSSDTQTYCLPNVSDEPDT